MKTIKQIAEELGVSKQAVYKRFKGKLYTEVYPYTHTERSVVYIDEVGENIIKSDFLRDRSNSEPHTGAHTDTVKPHTKPHTEYTEYTATKEEYNALIDTLQKTITVLTEQLAIKDKQIESLTQLLNQQQHLHAKDIKLLPQEPTAEQSTSLTLSEGKPAEPKKKSVFAKLFRKNMNNL